MFGERSQISAFCGVCLLLEHFNDRQKSADKTAPSRALDAALWFP
jgi:hypothetical protein